MDPDDVQARQEGRTDRVDRRQEGRTDRAKERQEQIADHHKEHHDDYEEYRDWDEYQEDRWRFAVGASLTAATFRSLSCRSTRVIVDGVTYYRCDDYWYRRSYRGGDVTYVVVNAPAGY